MRADSHSNRNRAYCAFRRTPGGRHSDRRTPVSTRAPRLAPATSGPRPASRRGHRPEPPEKTADESRRGTSGSRKSLSKIKDYDGSRATPAGSRGVVRYAETVVLRGSGAPLAPPRAHALHADRMGNAVVRSSIRRGARPDRVTRELGYRAACPQAARTPRVPSGLESAMIPTRSGSVSRANRRHVVRGEHASYARQEVRDAHAGMRDSVGGRPARGKSGRGLDRRFRGRPAASRACSLHSSPAATLDSAARSAELSKYGRKAELPSAAGRRRFCSATRIYSCCGEPSHPPGERKAALCTSQ